MILRNEGRRTEGAPHASTRQRRETPERNAFRERIKAHHTPTFRQGHPAPSLVGRSLRQVS